MKIIRDGKGQELAVILKMDDYASLGENVFFTEPEESLQVGSLLFREGGMVVPHIHKAKKVGTAYPVTEMILILCGEAELDVYDEEKRLVGTEVVSTGMMLVLKRGGHGYRFGNGTVRLLDVRCGPYVDKVQDKEMIGD